MLDKIPVQAWLLLGAAAAGYVPARYVCRYVAHDPSRRDITQPREDLSWRTAGRLARNLAILGALAAFAVFIFTPAAAAFARSPTFFPILIIAGGALSSWSVISGFSTGRIEPLVRGFNDSYERESQPKRFWASMLWNGLFGCAMLWFGFTAFRDAPEQALRDRCTDAKQALPPQEALSACRELIGKRGEGDGEMAELMAARGFAYFRLGDFPHAKADLAEAIRLDPQNAIAHYNLGLVHTRLGSKSDAIAAYGAAIKAGTSNGYAYLNRGLLYFEAGEVDQAIADFTRAHELDPKNPSPIALRGFAHAWKKETDRATDDFTSARALDPSNWVALRGDALLSKNRGDFRAAVDLFSQVLAADPGDSWSLEMRAEAYRELGDDARMRADIAALRRLEGSPDAAR
jgi:tetratricopeptide (TPR) repeat protein